MLRRLLEEWRRGLCSCPVTAGYGHWADCVSDNLNDLDLDELADVVYSYVRTLFDLEAGPRATEHRLPVVGSDDVE